MWLIGELAAINTYVLEKHVVHIQVGQLQAKGDSDDGYG